ncbi:class I adenylate-forming enzyme family protein [Mycolicibacterium thermoresistibile]|uniref:Fatty-acid--CoA ligase n=2 Tax=Mycolicibacterium thermoresistibile TaxID=1797 RepID=G7CH67_MYCT3|nr:AMP-binding protein [Mycolicibacterium thermoresistibile]EHI12177.1 fatty-acid--CoA ligase [Mycolicibacterium thermoresistibile ATCC 19527]MCV7191108.1 AMP-binding protein [Mycolicibacterium thermoresistibile]GAT15544.1 fatty-acid--CoA ligase [Mycolicibacterium thermoresistibile]SNW16905.1 acyl-CoA synthetase (AMP-forming)/AMP-acid ligase II [Mycolicibacterium thermoresistibile]
MSRSHLLIGDLITRAARTYGAAPALVHGDRVMSFREFDDATNRLGNALLARGLRPGDHVAVLAPNGIDGVVTYYALAKAGLVRVPLNSRETDFELAYKIDDSQARALVTDGRIPAETELVIHTEELAGMIAGADPGPCRIERDPEDPLRLAYTGGTTGKPKAVVLTTRSELAEIANFLVDLLPDLTPDSVMLHAAPITHGSGAFFLPHLVKGARNVILPRFTPQGFVDAAVEHGATATFMVPTMIAMMLEDAEIDRDRLKLRRLCYGGAPIAPTLLARGLETLGPVFVQLYGQAEAPLAITCLQPWEHTPERLTSAGKPYTFVEMDIRDEEDNSVPPGTPGEVVTRGPHTMSGYWRRPEATAETLGEDGWLRTGDIGQVDEEGYLYLLDRRNDVIISGGFNVYPREVEDALLTHPAVREAVVVGVDDERWGQRVSAAVVLREEVDTQALIDHCAERLAGFKRPRHIEVWDELPKSPVGKSLRRTVRETMRANEEVTAHA